MKLTTGEASRCPQSVQRYYSSLATEARTKDLPSVITKMRDESSIRFLHKLQTYRMDVYKIIDDDTYEVISGGKRERGPHVEPSTHMAREAREAHAIPSPARSTYPTQPTRPTRLTTSTCLTRPTRAISPTPPNVTSNKDTAKHNKGNFNTNVPLVRGHVLHPPRLRPVHIKLSVCRPTTRNVRCTSTPCILCTRQ
ncbi:flavin-dependent monooxygenase FMO3B [Danaus plexippus plexippus]|uniref:Flavin-dependent monooxygenase FMO3B n=1 Tax=Danaus plexippus plexippus TaxID=278856 RepID=A0A212ERA6_DANPL|nr:flavin-dependent monooxygenase FMO3B [Danaus plexippus plexippus]